MGMNEDARLFLLLGLHNDSFTLLKEKSNHKHLMKYTFS
jgi:hypothetical protein